MTIRWPAPHTSSLSKDSRRPIMSRTRAPNTAASPRTEDHAMERRFLCYFEGRGNEWEAISVDYDIAVYGHSLDEVKNQLKSAILTYIEDAGKERGMARKRLLGRRIPKTVQLRWFLKIIAHGARRPPLKRGDTAFEGRFEFSCPV
jgi:hypothetical protein